MSLTFLGAQTQVDERMKKNPKGYWEDDEIFKKMTEKQQEIKDALADYQASPTDDNLKKLKTEFGDKLFAIICLANKLQIPLNESFDLMMEKNKNRAKNNYEKEEK